MKKSIYAIAMLLVSVTYSNAQEIKVDKTTHEYGTIKNAADGNCYFEITNTGTEPLIITGAKGSCGCTVPEYSQDPIAPGKSTKMKVHYDTMRTGEFNKSVTITTNAITEPTKVVNIHGIVLAPEGTTTPAPGTAPAPTH
ncbi:MAG: DUF1573 domain-containing protein [Bacteroidota bacterium]